MRSIDYDWHLGGANKNKGTCSVADKVFVMLLNRSEGAYVSSASGKERWRSIHSLAELHGSAVASPLPGTCYHGGDVGLFYPPGLRHRTERTLWGVASRDRVVGDLHCAPQGGV